MGKKRFIAKTTDGREVAVRAVSNPPTAKAATFNLSLQGRVETEDGKRLSWVTRGHYRLHDTIGTVDLYCEDPKAP